MSIKIMTEVLDNSASKLGARLVLLAIADHANDKSRECWPCQERLAEMANMTVRHVRRCVTELVNLGELEIVEPGNGHRSTRYRILPLTGQIVLPEAAGDVRPEETSSPEDCAGCPPWGYENVRQTVIEPSIEPSLNRKPPQPSVAQQLVADWSESVTPHRQVLWPAAVKIINKFLDAGWSEEQLQVALAECNTISFAWIENALARQRQSTQPAYTVNGV